MSVNRNVTVPDGRTPSAFTAPASHTPIGNFSSASQDHDDRRGQRMTWFSGPAHSSEYPDLLTVAEAADFLRISRALGYQLASIGSPMEQPGCRSSSSALLAGAETNVHFSFVVSRRRRTM